MFALEVNSLTKTYGNTTVLDNISFKVKRNSIHGFIGANGAGKTTTFKCICGLIPFDTGQVLLNQTPVDWQSDEFKLNVGALIEEGRLYRDLSVKEFLTFIAKLYRLNNISDKVDEVIQRLQLGQVAHKLIENLSKGYRQRTAIAATIIHAPQFIILDEPTVGLDIEAMQSMRELIQELKQDHTILLSSHNLNEIEYICDEVSFIHQGQVINYEAFAKEKDFYYLKIPKSIERTQLELALQKLSIPLESIQDGPGNLESFFWSQIKQP